MVIRSVSPVLALSLKYVLVLQVDPSLRMDIAEPGGGNTRGVLFQLHPVILLNS